MQVVHLCMGARRNFRRRGQAQPPPLLRENKMPRMRGTLAPCSRCLLDTPAHHTINIMIYDMH